MDKLDYQDLLSKCIQNGLPGGRYWKSSSALQGKAEPAVGTARLFESSTSGVREDSSGDAQGSPAKSVAGNRVVTGMDGTAMNKLRSPFVATPKSAGKARMRERVLRSEDLKIGGFPRYFLKSRGMVTKTPPSTFSFRNLLQGAISASRAKPSTSVQKMAESGIRSAPNVEPEKDCVSLEKYPLADESLIGERHDDVVSGRSMPQSLRDANVFSVEGLAKSWTEEGNFAVCVRDSGSLCNDTVGDSGPRVSYSSLLQAQLGDDVDDVRTQTPQKTAGSSLVDVEAHSSLLNPQLQSAEVEGGFFPLREKTMPLLPFVAQRATFPGADSVSIGEQISDVHHSNKPSYGSTGAQSRSAGKMLERDLSEPLRATANPALSRIGQDVSRTEVVVAPGNPLVADPMCIWNGTLNFQPPEGDDTALAGDESRFADILSEKDAIDLSEAVVVPVLTVATRIEEHASPAEVVGDQENFVVANSVCIDEMSDVQLLEELSRALAADESRFAGQELNGDALESSEAAAVPALSVSTNSDENDARALVARKGSTLGVVEFVSTDERMLDAQVSEEPSGTVAMDESRSAENGLHRDVLESLEAAAVVPESFGLTRIEAGLPAGLATAGFVVAGSKCCDENVSGVQLPEELSRDLALDTSRSAEVVRKDGIDSLEAATVAVSPVPLLMEENVSGLEGVVVGFMDNGEEISDMVVSEGSSHAVALDRSRSAGNIFIGSSGADGDSPVPSITGEDVSMSKIVGAGCCSDAVVDIGQGEPTRRSWNPSNGQVLEERIQSPLQCLVTEKDRLEGQADLVNADTTLELAFKACHKQMDPNIVVQQFNVCYVQTDCGVGCVSETDVTVSEDVTMASLSVERDLSLQKVAVDEHGDASSDENLRSEELRDTGTVRKCSWQAAFKQTENDSVMSIQEQNNEMCDAHKCFPRGNVSFKSNLGFDVMEVAVERELDFSKGELVHSVHTEEVIDELNLNALVEKSSSTLISSNGHLVRGESHPTLQQSGARSFCFEGMSEPIDVAAVPGSSCQACMKPTEDINGVVRKGEEDNSCYTQVLEKFMSQDSSTTGEHLMSGDHGCGSQGCVESTVITSTTVLLHGNGNLVDLGRIHTDGRDPMVSLTENKLDHEHMLGRPEGSSEVVKRSEVEQDEALALADEAPELQMEVSRFSEIRAVNMGLNLCKAGNKCKEIPLSWLPLVEVGMRNEVDKEPESHVGEIVVGATDLDPTDQVLRTHPDAISEGLRQVFLRDSDATISDSLESAQGTGAELVAGIEVQSPLVTKSKARHVRHLHDLEDSHIGHLEDLENPRTRHLDALDENENEERSLASPLNGAVHDQLVGAVVRPYKKKARLRVYNHEKAIRGTGRSHFNLSASKRHSQLQKAGNRCRRKRHIYPDQPVPVFIEGRDEGFDEADGCSFSRWLARKDEGNTAPAPALGKSVREHGPELVNSIIAIPSFRVVPDYEQKRQEAEKRRKFRMQLQPISSSRPTFVSLSTVQPSEYDMDDEDEDWLHAWNKRLTRDGLKQPISEDKFEEMIDHFERQSAEMIVSAAGVFPGFPHSGKSLAHAFPGGYLPRTRPSGLGLLSTNLATSGTPVSGNSPTLNSQATLTPYPPRLQDVSGSGKHAVVSPSIRVDRNSPSPASIVCFHTLISENEINPANSDVDAVCERPCEGLLRKSLEPSVLVNLSIDCCICNGGEDDENNPVYTCKLCLIHVHQSCYGIREKFRDDKGRVIAPLNWCCRKCEAVAVGRAQPNVSCAVCRKRGGALKPTVVAQKWAHVACALYTNETFFVDPDAMEPIDGIAAVAARAQEQHERCELCGVKKGICSRCAVKICRAPFHISCGVSQGASFELRQSKQKVVGVRSFCPRHARTTAMDSAPSAELKDRHMLSSSGTNGATTSATASGSISTASSMDDREEWSSRQSISHPDGSFGEPAGLAKNVGRGFDLTDNAMSMNRKGVEDAGRAWSKGIRFALKRRRGESCDPVSEGGLSSDCHKKYGDGTGVSGGNVEGPGCKSTWQVDPGQKLRKIKFKFGRLGQRLDSESSPTLHQGMIGSEVPPAQKMKSVMQAVGELCGDAGVIDRDTEFLKGFSQDRFAKEVKELMILEEAMKSGMAPGRIMRELFVYWRAKRAEFKGSLLCELHHEQWLRSQGIFNKDASDEERGATGKMVALLRVAQQPSSMSYEKTLDMAKEIRMQLERVRWMAQMVVQREKLKYSRQFVLGSIASAELHRAERISENRQCVWCPSIKTLLKCGTCPRSFCFNCFKHRKGFGVKGWMTATKQPMYICKYCRQLSKEPADLSKNLDPASKEIEEDVAFSTPKDISGPAIGVVSTSVTSSKHVGGGRGNGMGKGRVKSRSWSSPGSGLLRVAEGVVMATVSKSVHTTEGKAKRLEIGLGNGNKWTSSNNGRCSSPRRDSEAMERSQRKPGQLEGGLDKFLSSAHSQIEHSSFETTLRRLKILRCRNTDPHQEVVTSSVEIPSGVIASGPGSDGMEGMKLSTTIGGNLFLPSSSCSGPALLVYKKKRKIILGESSESPPSAYDFGDQPCSTSELENGTSFYRITSSRQCRK